MPAARDSFYVYALVDPRDGQAFYIGKGTGKRVYQHEAAARNGRKGNSRCLRRIHEIWKADAEVVRRIVAEGLTEAEALKLERAEIGRIGLGNLTNVAPGSLTPNERGKLEASAFLASVSPDAFAGSPLLRRIERELQAIALGLIESQPTITIWSANGYSAVVQP